MRKSIVFVSFLSYLLVSCNSSTSPVSEQEQNLATIDSLESILFSNKEAKVDPKAGMMLVREYAHFYQENKEDSLATDMLFKAAEVSMGIGQGNLAIKYFKLISKDHSDFHKAPEAMFLTGFCSENLINDTAQARFIYEKFIKNFPDHKLAQDAQFSIQNLGMSDEDLIEMFENKLAKEAE